MDFIFDLNDFSTSSIVVSYLALTAASKNEKFIIMEMALSLTSIYLSVNICIFLPFKITRMSARDSFEFVLENENLSANN